MLKQSPAHASINDTLSETLKSLKRLALVYLDDLSPTIKRGIVYACAAASLWLAGIFLLVLGIRDAILENRDTALWCSGIALAMLIASALIFAKVVRMLLPEVKEQALQVHPSRSSLAHSL